MADIEEHSEDELVNDSLYEDPQPSPDPGHGLEEDEEEHHGVTLADRVSFFIGLLISLVMYFYVCLSILTILIIPASFTPLVTHPAINQSPNATNATQLVKDISRIGLLMVLFFIQDCIVCHFNIQHILERFNMESFARALYTLSTCIVLQVIRWLWKPMDEYVWHYSCDSTPFLVVMITVHALSWFFMAMSLFTCDYLELLGIKQIYYYYKGLDSPIQFKSEDQRELLSHMRYPFLLSPLLILWVVPTMTYDRLLLAIMIPLYIIWRNKLRDSDVAYVRMMYREKRGSLFKTD